MLTQRWTTEKIGSGRYHVRLSGNRIPGMILGGNRRYVVQLGGNQWPTVRKSLKSAAADLVSHHTGVGTVYF